MKVVHRYVVTEDFARPFLASNQRRPRERDEERAALPARGDPERTAGRPHEGPDLAVQGRQAGDLGLEPSLVKAADASVRRADPDHP